MTIDEARKITGQSSLASIAMVALTLPRETRQKIGAELDRHIRAHGCPQDMVDAFRLAQQCMKI